jgi:hypothetical protein
LTHNAKIAYTLAKKKESSSPGKMSGCSYCRKSLDGCKEIKHPQSGYSYHGYGGKTKRTFFQCPWCEEIHLKEETFFGWGGPVGAPNVKALGKNPNVRI